MSGGGSPAPVTARDLNRWRLARQLLPERARLDVVTAPSPYIGLWSRLEGFQLLAHARRERVLPRQLQATVIRKATGAAVVQRAPAVSFTRSVFRIRFLRRSSDGTV